MKTLAAVTTSKGIGAISSIQITGQGAEAIINKIFKSGGVREPNFAVGNILVGNIIDGQQIIDHVVVACEGESNFAINCHGNPIIVEMIMKLLKDNGAELTTAEKFLANEFAKNIKKNSFCQYDMVYALLLLHTDCIPTIIRSKLVGNCLSVRAFGPDNAPVDKLLSVRSFQGRIPSPDNRNRTPINQLSLLFSFL